jgi:hypothetical protein
MKVFSKKTCLTSFITFDYVIHFQEIVLISTCTPTKTKQSDGLTCVSYYRKSILFTMFVVTAIVLRPIDNLVSNQSLLVE